VVVVHHDPILPSWAGELAGARIAELDWQVVAQATVGAAGERIPALDAVLGAAPPSLTVYVEVKARGIERTVAECLTRHPDRRAAVHSFDHRVARQVHELVSAVPAGILVDSYLIDSAHALHAAGARDYWPHLEMVDQSLVDAIHRAGGRVIVWTVNDPADARRLAAMGVDGLCSDVIDELRDALGD
jgi:glycerophosphoryl diester phosphodiesterase